MAKMVLACGIMLLLVISLARLQYVDAQEDKPILIINKIVDRSTFTWLDKIEIKITVSNEGSITSSNVLIIDYVPTGFIAEPKQGVTIESDKVTTIIDEIKSGKDTTVSYTLKAIDGMGSKSPITFQLPRAEVHYFASENEIIKKSNQLTVTIQSTTTWWDLGIVASLIVISFGFGSFGATINWLNADAKIKKQRKDNKEKIGYYTLLGGAAGVIVLAGFEGLSMLFSEGQLKLNIVNIITLIGTCFAAGFAPMAVIDRATKQWRSELETTKTEMTGKLEKAVGFIEKLKRDGVIP